MSFRDAASSVRAGIKSGAYQKKTDNFSAFAQGFAPIFAQGMKDKKDLKMAELKTIAEEKRYQRRLTDAAQAKTDLYDKKTQEVAELLWNEWGLTDEAAKQRVLAQVAASNNNYTTVNTALEKQYEKPKPVSKPPSITSPVNQTETVAPVVPSAVVAGDQSRLANAESGGDINIISKAATLKVPSLADHKVSQHTIEDNIYFARPNGDFWNATIGSSTMNPNAAATGMGKWQFVHNTLKDIAKRTNNFTEIDGKFADGLKTVFDEEAQDKLNAWYMNDTYNEVMNRRGAGVEEFVRVLKVRYEGFTAKDSNGKRLFSDPEIVDIAMQYVSPNNRADNGDKSDWSTGGSWFNSVDYSKTSAVVPANVDTQTDTALTEAEVSGGLVPKGDEPFKNKFEAERVAADPNHSRYQEAIEILEFINGQGKKTAADTIAEVSNTREAIALQAKIRMLPEGDYRSQLSNALIPLMQKFEILDQAKTKTAAEILMTIGTRMKAAALEAAIREMPESPRRDKLISGLATLKPQLELLDPNKPPVITGPLRDTNGKMFPLTTIQTMALSGTATEKEAATEHLNKVREFNAREIDLNVLDTVPKITNFIADADLNGFIIEPAKLDKLKTHMSTIISTDASNKLPNISTLGSVADVTTYRLNYKAAFGDTAVIPELIEQALVAQENHFKIKEARAAQGKPLTLAQEARNIITKQPWYSSLKPAQQLDVLANYASVSKDSFATVAEAVEAIRIANLMNDTVNAQRIENILTTSTDFKKKVWVVHPKTDRAFTGYVNGKGEIVSSGKDMDPEVNYETIDWDKTNATLQKRIGQMTTDYNAYNNKVVSVFSLASGMAEIIDIAEKNEGVLTGTAGLISKISSTLNNADTALGILGKMRPQNGQITLQAYEQELRNNQLLKNGETLASLSERVLGTEAKDLAEARKILEAKLVIMQFRTGGAEGQSGTAMSNADRVEFFKFLKKFDNADQLKTVYMDYLRNSMESLELEHSTKFTTIEQDRFLTMNSFIPDVFFAFSPKEIAEQNSNPKWLRMYNAITEGGSLSGAASGGAEVGTGEGKVAVQPPKDEVPRADPPAAAITDLNTRYAAAKTPEARALLLKQFKDHFKIDGSQYLSGDK
tara:strand:+ start:2780 stop:6142 length:3363 start_codon:yes stop_codon:yes gene_type:complete